jgi:hypothetical protein
MGFILTLLEQEIVTRVVRDLTRPDYDPACTISALVTRLPDGMARRLAARRLRQVADGIERAKEMP